MNELLIFFVIIISILSSMNYLKRQKLITYETSKIDNRKYLVRKEKNSKEAADIFATLNKNIMLLINSVQNSKKENTHLLTENYNPDTLSETIPGSKYTSYSVNKGEKISICIRDVNNNFMDMNTILFVVSHELAHVMSLSSGHTDEFWDNMKFLLEEAEKISIYKPIDYKKNNVNYCGMVINSTPYDFKH
jgi:predicted metal-dependent hydrolase